LLSDLELEKKWPQNTIFSAEQSAIITAIHYTIKKTGKKTHSNSVCSFGQEKYENPADYKKTTRTRERDKITLLP
jgi:hypothetical protein